MPSPLGELVDFLIKHQWMLKQIELEKGGGWNYIDENGQYVLEYPDGHIEKAELPEQDLAGIELPEIRHPGIEYPLEKMPRLICVAGRLAPL